MAGVMNKVLANGKVQAVPIKNLTWSLNAVKEWARNHVETGGNVTPTALTSNSVDVSAGVAYQDDTRVAFTAATLDLGAASKSKRTVVYGPAGGGAPLAGTIGITSNAATLTVTESTKGSSVNEIQTLTGTGTLTAGTFTLTYSGQTTSALNYNATHAEVQAALIALSNIGTTDVVCAGGPLNTTPITCTFQGTLAGTDVATLIVTPVVALTKSCTITVAPTPEGSAEADEVQVLTAPTPLAGTFTLTYSGQTTSALQFNASATDIQTALRALSNIEDADMDCTGGPINTTPVNCTFVGALAKTDVALMTVTSSLSNAASVAVTTSPTGSSAREVQAITAGNMLIGGTFRLAFGGYATTDLPYNATAAQVQAALIALTSIGTGNVTCAGGPLNANTSPITVTFTSAMANIDEAMITVDSNKLVQTTEPCVPAGATPLAYVLRGTDNQIVASEIDNDAKPKLYYKIKAV